MLVTKSIGFNMNDIDAVVLEIAEEIKKGWHISSVENNLIKTPIYERLNDSAVTIHFIRR